MSERVDNLTPQNMPAQPSGVAEAKPGFLSTTRGKIILIAGAIVGFLVVAGIAAALVFTFILKGAEEVVQDAVSPVASQNASATLDAEESEIIIEPAEVPLSDLFTFRDIFEPLIRPAAEPGSEAETSTETPTLFVGELDTLYLLDIVVEDGVNKAVLSFNGTEYRLAEGATLPGTPWQVLSIGGSSAVMLYGDSQVSLSVGQGVIDNTTSTTAGSTAK